MVGGGNSPLLHRRTRTDKEYVDLQAVMVDDRPETNCEAVIPLLLQNQHNPRLLVGLEAVEKALPDRLRPLVGEIDLNRV